MSDENKKYVPEGVFLVCDMGATPSQLIATPRKVNLYGPMMATEADNKFTLNILPFGVCKKIGAPCAFACVQWTKTKSGNVFANNEKLLLEDSEALCAVGQGKIKIFFDKYEADLANENNNESGFVSEEISSNILGQALTMPFGSIVDLFCDDDKKFTEGVGRGFKKGMEGTWNFLTNDMWKGETWKGLGKMVVIGAAYSGPTGYLMGETNLKSLDSAFGTDFVETKDALVNGVSDAASNAWEDVKRGETGEVGESVGQIYYAAVEAVVGTKGAGLVVKGLSTGAKALIGVERLAALTAKISKFANALKQGVLSVVKVGKKVVRGMSLDDFLKLFKNEKLAREAFEHWKNKDWAKLEDLFKTHNINDGYPPNGGAVSVNNTSLNPGQRIDRYGGWYDESGNFHDRGAFASPEGIPFEQRALPNESLSKPYKVYEVVKPIEVVKEGEVIPWFNQPGGGVQYELPGKIEDLVEGGYLKPIN